MTEVTRVPLQPIAKGSLTKLWLAVALVVLAAAGIAWAALPKGVTVTELSAGTGESPSDSDVVFVHYTGKLADGTVFDQSQPIPLPVEGLLPEGSPLPLSNMIPGFREAAVQMKKGGRYEFEIPAEKGYGANPQPGSPIPPNSDLVFEVELVDFMSEEEFQQRIQLLQQMMQAPQGAPGPGGASPPQ